MESMFSNPYNIEIEIEEYAARMAMELPADDKGNVPFEKLATRFATRFLVTDELSRRFPVWENNMTAFDNEILRYWTIQIVCVVASEKMREEKASRGETDENRIDFLHLIGDWAVWAENDPEIHNWDELIRKIDAAQIENEHWYDVYRNVEKDALIMKRNRNADLQQNYGFDNRRSKRYRSEPSIIACNKMDYITNHFFRAAWAVSSRQKKGKEGQSKIWRMKVAHSILEGCNCPLTQDKILDLYARIKDAPRGREEGHRRRTTMSMHGKEHIEMMRFFLAIALYYSPYTTYERYIIQHHEYVAGWEDVYTRDQYYAPIYFFKRYGVFQKDENEGVNAYLCTQDMIKVTFYFWRWKNMMILYWRAYFKSLQRTLSPHKILCALNALELPRTAEEEPLWPVKIAGGYPLHH